MTKWCYLLSLLVRYRYYQYTSLLCAVLWYQKGRTFRLTVLTDRQYSGQAKMNVRELPQCTRAMPRRKKKLWHALYCDAAVALKHSQSHVYARLKGCMFTLVNVQLFEFRNCAGTKTITSLLTANISTCFQFSSFGPRPYGRKSPTVVMDSSVDTQGTHRHSVLSSTCVYQSMLNRKLE